MCSTCLIVTFIRIGNCALFLTKLLTGSLYKYGPEQPGFSLSTFLGKRKPNPRNAAQVLLVTRQGQKRDSGQGALTVRAAAIEGHPADAAVLVVGYPEPSGHAVPAFDLHLHGARSLRGGKRPPGCAESAELRHLETKEGVSPQGSSAGNSGRRRAIRAVCKRAGAGAGSSGRPGGPVVVLGQHRTSAPASAEGVVSFL